MEAAFLKHFLNSWQDKRRNFSHFSIAQSQARSTFKKKKKEHLGKGRKGRLGEVSVKLQHVIKIHKDFSEEASIVGNYWGGHSLTVEEFISNK